ncbi:MAG: MscS Mechanosensitive ion channel [Ignavibacteria bacterium]|nr:MAG: MscS Mechanosensitive ion channel [Ignavibacteria bacterium]KAF0161865.1 MAG: MscS Mechanosensitive ion channel [Ignavibacteria bacterium]
MFQKFTKWLNALPWINDTLLFFIILALALFSYIVLRGIIFASLKSIVKKTSTQIDDILFSKTFLRRISYLAPLFIIYHSTGLIPIAEKELDKLLSILFVLAIFLSIGAILSAVIELHDRLEKFKERPIKGYIQIIKIILYSFMVVLIVGIIFGQTVWSIVTGLGAFTAILILIFRDTILNFIASMQISSYDLVRVGDWIEVPKFGADGDVIDISLMIVKVQNFDKTITIIPTYKLIEETFKNWRGMQQSGVRRIKRSVYIDQTSIRFCTKDMLDRFEKINIISNYIKDKRAETEKANFESGFDLNNLVNGRRLTNIGTFRAYLIEYLRQRNDISKDFSFQVRQMPASPDGLPIEIYAYATKTNFVDYEDAQADIFDHILAIVPEFDLRLFQNPSGVNIQK